MVLLECLLSPKTTIPCDSEMALVVEQLIAQKITQQQITYIEASAWQENALNFIAPIVINPINNSKNRFQEIVPGRYLTEHTKIYYNFFFCRPRSSFNIKIPFRRYRV